ncbi:hypothetical protein SpiGrapes_2737 [Sphaerochaeta pleomorpha str. Grapes]|uniref:Outer membrane protein beta-barrel domain-containing protein n=1 Tax=Sphaerochaeta pleomorpha (strain ATCC BAA-1885 / DSM 22778 / Grapes) TaxID=158190 RepID=G8QVX0_SPHPG|nr:hypothetical protein [Sphaerochaeta pleomorpha]AEV30494.1 hypothetical protein SpiGrapes_2737 [Sphaerochaeta pleomorpha str. Grapes]
MKKRMATLLLLFICIPALFAGTFDLGFTLGTNTHFYEHSYDNDAVKFAYGATIGMTDILELDLQANSQLVPRFFADTNVLVMVQRTLQGQRNTGKKIAGIGVNTLVGAGVMFSDYHEGGQFVPTHLLFSVTPITIGSPYAGKRERILSFTLAYNMYNNQISLVMDLLKNDFYVIGTYRDWRP